MNKTFVSMIALCATLGFAAVPAYAQTAVGGVEVLEEDLAAVQAACIALETENTGATAGSAANSLQEGGSEGDDDDDGDDAGTVDGDQTNAIDDAVTTFDLSTLTAEQCEEAGLTSADVTTDGAASAEGAASTEGAASAEGAAAAGATTDGGNATAAGTGSEDTSGATGNTIGGVPNEGEASSGESEAPGLQ